MFRTFQYNTKAACCTEKCGMVECDWSDTVQNGGAFMQYWV